MRRPQIGVDVDSVIAALLEVWLRLYNEEYDDDLQVQDITAWDISQFAKPECGKAIFKYLAHPYLYDMIEPIDGALEGVAALAELGDVSIVTSAGIDSALQKLEWLKRHGFMQHVHQVFTLTHGGKTYTPNKGLIHLDFLIDDYTGNLEPFTGQGILFRSEAPYTHDDYRWPVVDNWDQAVRVVSSLIAAPAVVV